MVRAVRDPRDEVVDAGRGVDVRRADLAELVEQAVTQLSPVLPQLLLELLTLLLLLLSHSMIPSSWFLFAWRSPREETLSNAFAAHHLTTESAWIVATHGMSRLSWYLGFRSYVAGSPGRNRSGLVDRLFLLRPERGEGAF
ncbi:hypothetical protein FRACA_480044 [Frankia canadensis]|uniref:Uncharacterized protein n=1 Tax=Frankia canadensis TaxID=1836972 RepID=A0A2I2KY16_9ACTN|nr:hypothetical protein FRACA_480044 [Frankia canadensis]SOU57845.1 hypothetical protein FRACA_480044 [Frankia canadensis]